MTTTTLTKSRTTDAPARKATPITAPKRLEQRWFKVEGKLECRWIEV